MGPGGETGEWAVGPGPASFLMLQQQEAAQGVAFRRAAARRGLEKALSKLKEGEHCL